METLDKNTSKVDYEQQLKLQKTLDDIPTTEFQKKLKGNKEFQGLLEDFIAVNKRSNYESLLENFAEEDREEIKNEGINEEFILEYQSIFGKITPHDLVMCWKIKDKTNMHQIKEFQDKVPGIELRYIIRLNKYLSLEDLLSIIDKLHIKNITNHLNNFLWIIHKGLLNPTNIDNIINDFSSISNEINGELILYCTSAKISVTEAGGILEKYSEYGQYLDPIELIQTIKYDQTRIEQAVILKKQIPELKSKDLISLLEMNISISDQEKEKIYRYKEELGDISIYDTILLVSKNIDINIFKTYSDFGFNGQIIIKCIENNLTPDTISAFNRVLDGPINYHQINLIIGSKLTVAEYKAYKEIDTTLDIIMASYLKEGGVNAQMFANYKDKNNSLSSWNIEILHNVGVNPELLSHNLDFLQENGINLLNSIQHSFHFSGNQVLEYCHEFQDKLSLENGKNNKGYMNIIGTAMKTNIPSEWIGDFFDVANSVPWRRFEEISTENLIKLYEINISLNNLLEDHEQVLGKFMNINHLIELKTMPGYYELMNHLKGEAITITIGKEEISLTPDYHSIQLIRGILINLSDNNIDIPTDNQGWNNIITDYSNTLNEFIESDNHYDTVFFIGANGKREDHNGAFSGIGKIKEVLENQYENMNDFSTGTEKGGEIHSPKDFIAKIKEYINANPTHKVLIYIGLHGGNDGSANFSKGNFGREDFEEIANISTNISLNIDSCYSGTKLTDEKKLSSNVYLSSQNNVSYAAHSALFVESHMNTIKLSENEMRVAIASFSKTNGDISNTVTTPDAKGDLIDLNDKLQLINLDGENINVGELKTLNGKNKLTENQIQMTIDIMKLINQGILSFNKKYGSIYLSITKDEIDQLDISEYTANFLKIILNRKVKKNLGDFNEDGKVGYNESRLYQLLNYHDSFLPTSFLNKSGNIINIAKIDNESINELYS